MRLLHICLSVASIVIACAWLITLLTNNQFSAPSLSKIVLPPQFKPIRTASTTTLFHNRAPRGAPQVPPQLQALRARSEAPQVHTDRLSPQLTTTSTTTTSTTSTTSTTTSTLLSTTTSTTSTTILPHNDMPSVEPSALKESSTTILLHSNMPSVEPSALKKSSTTSTTSVFYNHTSYFERWVMKDKYSLDRMPRVLIFSWCTEDTHLSFVNALYWLSCYAHAHGFDIVLDSSKNFDGVKKMAGYDGNDVNLGWYNDDNMWAWIPALKPYLFSGKWDYVFVVGIDVLLNGIHLSFPVWAYDQGHDITIMDQFYLSIGLNENGMLFKPTKFTEAFLDQLFEYRSDFYLQGDNAPWMEMILRALGQEAWMAGRDGYGGHCAPKMLLPVSCAYLVKVNYAEAVRRMTDYSKCFFKALDTLAGPYGHRKSKNIGFSPTYYADNPSTISQYIDRPDILTPWSNCFNTIRQNGIYRPQLNCFLFHYNGPKEGMFDRIQGGTCPDPTFDWYACKNNPDPSLDWSRG